MLKLWNGAIWFQYLKLEIHFVFRKPFWLRKLSYLLSTERWQILDTFLCGVLVNWTLVYAADAPLQRVEATQVRLANQSSLSSCQWTNQRSSLPGQQSSGVSGSSYQDHKWHCILSSQPPPSSLDRGTYAEGFITIPLYLFKVYLPIALFILLRHQIIATMLDIHHVLPQLVSDIDVFRQTINFPEYLRW